MKNRLRAFISYTWVDWQKEVAERLAKGLRRRQIEPWIDTDQITLGKTLRSRLEEGILEETDCFICLLSPEYLQATIAPTELETAIARCQVREKPVFPILIAPIPKGSLIIRLGDRVWGNYTDIRSSTGSIQTEVLDRLVNDLARAIRQQFASRPEVERFFAPSNDRPVLVVSNRAYMTSDPTQRLPTTALFEKETTTTLNTLQRRAVLKGFDPVGVERLRAEGARQLVEGPDNLVSYASSKINRVTDLMLRKIEVTRGSVLRFILQSDIDAGKLRSRLPNLSKGAHVDLLVEGTRYRYSTTRDHGLIFRGHAGRDDPRRWWVFAGCGRAGSVAARKLVFDTDWKEYMWPALGQGWPQKDFAVVFTVPYKRSEEPAPPCYLHVHWYDS